MGQYVGRDEMCDTIEENLRPVENALGKIQDQVDRDMAALELRVERTLAAHKTKVVPFPLGNAVSPKDFQRAQEDIDDLRELVALMTKVAKQQSLKITSLIASVEELSDLIGDLSVIP